MGGGGGGGGACMALRLKLAKLLGKTRTVWGMIWGVQLLWKTAGIAYTGIRGKMIYMKKVVQSVCLSR
jgi:hypothetical protein